MISQVFLRCRWMHYENRQCRCRNSATALSQIINRRIDMDVPRVSIVPLEEVPELVGGPDTMVVGVFLRVYGKAPSNILFLLPRDSAFYLVDMLMGKKHGDTQKLDFMDESALMEIGNILSGAYLNALFNFTNISLLPSIPALAMDMAGAILSVVLVQLGRMGDHALVIETEFKLRMMVSRVISSSYQIQVRWR